MIVSLLTSKGNSMPNQDAEPELVLCTVSGGYDSAAALLWSLQRQPTKGIFVDYTQRYLGQELRAMRRLVTWEGVAHHSNWRGITTLHVPLGLMPEDNPWVPYRNLVIASLLANQAVGCGAKSVIFGSKSLDYRPEDKISYKDSTRAFYEELHDFIGRFSEPQNVGLVPEFTLPLVGWSKVEVLEYLHDQGVDLNALWNCYSGQGGESPCQSCEHCVITQPLIEQVLKDKGVEGYRYPPGQFLQLGAPPTTTTAGNVLGSQS